MAIKYIEEYFWKDIVENTYLVVSLACLLKYLEYQAISRDC